MAGQYWQWAKANPAEAQKMLKAFYAGGGLNISDETIKKEFANRPTFALLEQLALMNSTVSVDSKLAYALQRMGIFLRESGAINSTRPAQKKITSKYLRMIEASPELTKTANNSK